MDSTETQGETCTLITNSRYSRFPAKQSAANIRNLEDIPVRKTRPNLAIIPAFPERIFVSEKLPVCDSGGVEKLVGGDGLDAVQILGVHVIGRNKQTRRLGKKNSEMRTKERAPPVGELECINKRVVEGGISGRKKKYELLTF